MRAHRAEATVAGNGRVTVEGVPFAEGEAVEVIVLPREPSRTAEDHPLRGSVRRYTDPFDPATDSDAWDATRGAA